MTRCWQSAKSAPCLHAAGRQVHGGRQAVTAMLHTIRHQRSAWRGPPHDGRRKVVTVCDTPLVKR
jgi:hypothetical protein